MATAFDDIFSNLHDEPYRVSGAIVDFISSVGSLQKEVSTAIGWKGESSYPFGDRFDGYYVRYVPDSNDIVLYNWGDSTGQAVRLAVRPAEDGSVEVTGSEAEALGIGGVHPEEEAKGVLDKALAYMRGEVLTETNIEAARKYSHHGHTLLPYVRLRNETVIGVPEPCPLSLRKEMDEVFSKRFSNCVFIPNTELKQNINDYYSRNTYPGIENDVYVIDLLYYDGKNIFNRINVDIPGLSPREQREADAVLLDQVKGVMRQVRRELQLCAGCGEDHSFNVRFRDALYPMAEQYRSDMATICSGCGENMDYAFRVKNGMIIMADNINGSSTVDRKAMTLEQMESFVRSVVLTKKNIEVAQGEVSDYHLTEALDAPCESKEAIYVEGLLNRRLSDISLTVVKEENLSNMSIYHVVLNDDSKSSIIRKNGEFYFPDAEADHFINAHSAAYNSWVNERKERFSFSNGDLHKMEKSNTKSQKL